MQKTIRLSINGTDLAFDVTTELYNKYVNEMMPNNKVAPAHNFAMRCVADGSREDLKSLLELAYGTGSVILDANPEHELFELGSHYAPLKAFAMPFATAICIFSQ